MPTLSALFTKFVLRQTLLSAERESIRADIEAGHAIYKTTAQWAGVTLADKAIGIETDSTPRKMKIGDGVTAWASLPYAGGGQASDSAYDATAWNGNADAPTKNAVRDKIETLAAEKQPLDADLTAYANAADASARRALIGAGTNNLPAPLQITALPVDGLQVEELTITIPGGVTSAPGTYNVFITAVSTGETEMSFTIFAPLASTPGFVASAIAALLPSYAINDDYIASSVGSRVILTSRVAGRHEPSLQLRVEANLGISAATSIETASGITVPAITAIGQPAIATVGGVVSQWSAVSLYKWMEVTNTTTVGVSMAALEDLATADPTAFKNLLISLGVIINE